MSCCAPILREASYHETVRCGVMLCGAAIYPGEHHELRYEAVVIVCHLEESTESDYGGVLLYTVDGEDIIAYLEEKGEFPVATPRPPFQYQLAFCTPPLVGQVLPGLSCETCRPGLSSAPMSPCFPPLVGQALLPHQTCPQLLLHMHPFPPNLSRAVNCCPPGLSSNPFFPSSPPRWQTPASLLVTQGNTAGAPQVSLRCTLQAQQFHWLGHYVCCSRKSHSLASAFVRFQISPRRMYEWIEYHLHMGVDRIVVYDAGAVDAEVVAMLDAYTEQDISIQIVNVRQIKSYPSWDTGRLLTTNDCMYRHRFTARYATATPLSTPSWRPCLDGSLAVEPLEGFWQWSPGCTTQTVHLAVRESAHNCSERSPQQGTAH